jgi:hypothetical protein
MYLDPQPSSRSSLVPLVVRRMPSLDLIIVVLIVKRVNESYWVITRWMAYNILGAHIVQIHVQYKRTKIHNLYSLSLFYSINCILKSLTGLHRYPSNWGSGNGFMKISGSWSLEEMRDIKYQITWRYAAPMWSLKEPECDLQRSPTL